MSQRTYGNDVVRGYTWDPVWGSLKTAMASFEDAGTVTVQADAYSRDSAGRVTAVRDAVAGVSQCYAYDGFNRLEAAWTDTRSTDACEDGWTAAVQPLLPLEELGYALEYAYEPTGGVHAITDLLATTNATSTYAYSDASSPNAVTAVTGGATASSYMYDPAGRLTTRTVGGAGMGLVWDVSSNLVATMQTGQDRVYVYDASGQRVAQVKVGSLTSPTPQAATVYLGATEATDANTASTGPVSATRFITFGGSTVATATAATGGPVTWSLLFGDVRGSAQVSMELEVDTGEFSGFEPASELDHQVTRNAYQPYGSRRGPDALAVDRGWLGQTEDAGTGLTYLNARYYDPLIGRFLSPDPLMNPGDPRTLDPYRYADNNPITFTDASGLAPSCAMDPKSEAYKACAGYATKTYNYSTALTVQQNNANKGGLAYGKSLAVKPSGLAYPLPPTSVDLGNTSFVITFFIADAEAGQATTGFGDGASHGDARGFSTDPSDWIHRSRLYLKYDAQAQLLTGHVNPSCEVPETYKCWPSSSNNVSWSEPLCPDDTFCRRFSGVNAALNPVLTAVGPRLWQELYVSPNGNDGVTVEILGTGFPSLEAYTIRGDTTSVLIQDWQSRPSEDAAIGLWFTRRSVAFDVPQ